MSALTIDSLFDYPGLNGRPARCHLRVFTQGSGDVVLLATDLGDANPGASVTNTIQHIVTHAVERYGLDPARVTVIEHYDDRRTSSAHRSILPRRDGGEDFDLVTFAWAGAIFHDPVWQPLRKAQAEKIVGQPLP